MAASPHIVIIGGGAIGSAIAAYLTQPERQANHPCHVTVVERDPSCVFHAMADTIPC